jgi:hypothetical protein
LSIFSILGTNFTPDGNVGFFLFFASVLLLPFFRTFNFTPDGNVGFFLFFASVLLLPFFRTFSRTTTNSPSLLGLLRNLRLRLGFCGKLLNFNLTFLSLLHKSSSDFSNSQKYLTTNRFNGLLLSTDYEISIIRKSCLQIIKIDVTGEKVTTLDATEDMAIFVGLLFVFGANFQRIVNYFDIDLVRLEISEVKSHLTKSPIMIVCNIQNGFVIYT